MFPIDNPTAATTQPAPTVPGTPGFFTDGNAGAGTPATIVPGEWLNAVQQELLNVITAAGLTPTKTNQSQLLAALNALTGPGRLLKSTTFTSSTTWTPTTGATKWRIRGTGGGGGGSASTTCGAGVCSATAFGQSGAAGEFWFTGIAGAQTLTIGAGGTGGTTNGANGVNGGNTILGSLLTLPGGARSQNVPGAAAPYISGNAGSISTPTVGAGGNTVWSIGTNPAGGGSAVISNAVNYSGASNSSFGGSSQGYGAGGSGAFTAASGTFVAGSAGNPGFLTIEEFS